MFNDDLNILYNYYKKNLHNPGLVDLLLLGCEYLYNFDPTLKGSKVLHYIFLSIFLDFEGFSPASLNEMTIVLLRSQPISEVFSNLIYQNSTFLKLFYLFLEKYANISSAQKRQSYYNFLVRIIIDNTFIEAETVNEKLEDIILSCFKEAGKNNDIDWRKKFVQQLVLDTLNPISKGFKPLSNKILREIVDYQKIFFNVPINRIENFELSVSSWLQSASPKSLEKENYEKVFEELELLWSVSQEIIKEPLSIIREFLHSDKIPFLDKRRALFFLEWIASKLIEMPKENQNLFEINELNKKLENTSINSLNDRLDVLNFTVIMDNDFPLFRDQYGIVLCDGDIQYAPSSQVKRLLSLERYARYLELKPSSKELQKDENNNIQIQKEKIYGNQAIFKKGFETMQSQTCDLILGSASVQEVLLNLLNLRGTIAIAQSLFEIDSSFEKLFSSEKGFYRINLDQSSIYYLLTYALVRKGELGTAFRSNQYGRFKPLLKSFFLQQRGDILLDKTNYYTHKVKYENETIPLTTVYFFLSSEESLHSENDEYFGGLEHTDSKYFPVLIKMIEKSYNQGVDFLKLGEREKSLIHFSEAVYLFLHTTWAVRGSSAQGEAFFSGVLDALGYKSEKEIKASGLDFYAFVTTSPYQFYRMVCEEFSITGFLKDEL